MAIVAERVDRLEQVMVEFVTNVGIEFNKLFPEYNDRPLIGIPASLDVDASVLAYAQTQGFLVTAIGDQLIELKNRPGFEPKRWG